MNNAAKKIVVEANCRGGVSPTVIHGEGTQKAARTRSQADENYFAKVLRQLKDDQNLIYLAQRLQNYSEVTDARLYSLRQAIQGQDANAVVEIAHALTDATAKLGAIRMMKLCIAIQMLGRRGLLEKARELVSDLDHEYARFKETLIYAVG